MKKDDHSLDALLSAASNDDERHRLAAAGLAGCEGAFANCVPHHILRHIAVSIC